MSASPLTPHNALPNQTAPVERSVTLRVVIIALALAALFGYCVPIVDYKFRNSFLGATHLPAGAVGVLLALLLIVNPTLKLLRARAALTRNEVLTIYISCLFSALVPGRGSENFFVPNLLSSLYFATRENRWLELFQPYLKSWFTPGFDRCGHLNSTVVEGWYNGLAPGQSIPWGAWLLPLVAWGALILALQWMQGCLAVMLRAQWAEREALTFPLLKLPLELTKDMDGTSAGSTAFFRNPLMWVGFGASVLIETLNGLHLYFPDVPAIPLTLDSHPFFTEAPWNQVGNLFIQVFPIIVGISYLLTSEVSFSLWFFHVFAKFQLVIAYLLGYPPATLEMPFWTRGWAPGIIGYQQVGALLAYVTLLLWTGREHWKHIAGRAVGRRAVNAAELSEPLSYPVAFWGFFGALSFIVTWTIAAGVHWPVALLMWGFYLAVALALTRLVAEAGLLFVQTGWMPLGPLAFLVGAGPGHIIDVASAAPASMISSSLMLDMRGFLLPSFVQSFKLAHDRNIPLKPLLALILSVIVVSFSIGLWNVLRLGYGEGGLQLEGWWATAAGSQPAVHTLGITRGVETNFAFNWFWVGLGAAATWGMMLVRARAAWFPLHPLGLLMCLPFAMHAMWLSIFLGWLAKITITRFGGNDSYRKAIPLFLGLALGDIVMLIFWVIVDGWQGRVAHALLP